MTSFLSLLFLYSPNKTTICYGLTISITTVMMNKNNRIVDIHPVIFSPNNLSKWSYAFSTTFPHIANDKAIARSINTIPTINVIISTNTFPPSLHQLPQPLLPRIQDVLENQHNRCDDCYLDIHRILKFPNLPTRIL